MCYEYECTVFSVYFHDYCHDVPFRPLIEKKKLNFEPYTYRRHASVFSPPMFMEHDPQIPSLHDLLKVKVGSISSFILINASKTIGPHLKFIIVYQYY